MCNRKGLSIVSRPLAAVVFVFLLMFMIGCKTEQHEQGSMTIEDVGQNCSDKWPYICEGREEDNNIESIEVADDDQFRAVYLAVLDGSRSMGETRCADGQSKSVRAKNALIEWAETHIGDEAYLGLVAFDEAQGISVRVPFGYGPENREAFKRTVNETGADSATPLYSATKLAYDTTTHIAKLQLGRAGGWNIVIVTDGEANIGQDPTKIVNKIVDETEIQLLTIGFCIPSNHSLNQPGRTLYFSANSPEELTRAFERVAAESSR